MSAYFRFTDNENKETLLHVGMHPRELKTLILSWRYCESVQVDGDEFVLALQILGREYKGKNRVFTFVGQDAQTICVNWR